MIVLFSSALVIVMVLLCRNKYTSGPVSFVLMFCAALAYTFIIIEFYDQVKGST